MSWGLNHLHEAQEAVAKSGSESYVNWQDALVQTAQAHTLIDIAESLRKLLAGPPVPQMIVHKVLEAGIKSERLCGSSFAWSSTENEEVTCATCKELLT